MHMIRKGQMCSPKAKPVCRRTVLQPGFVISCGSSNCPQLQRLIATEPLHSPSQGVARLAGAGRDAKHDPGAWPDHARRVALRHRAGRHNLFASPAASGPRCDRHRLCDRAPIHSWSRRLPPMLFPSKRHMPHHGDMRLPLYRLKQAQRLLEAKLPGRIVVQPFSWSWYAETARRCKLYDYKAQCWTDFAGRPDDLGELSDVCDIDRLVVNVPVPPERHHVAGHDAIGAVSLGERCRKLGPELPVGARRRGCVNPLLRWAHRLGRPRAPEKCPTMGPARVVEPPRVCVPLFLAPTARPVALAANDHAP